MNIWIWLRRRDGAYISRRSERPTCVVVNALWECFTWDLDGFIWIYEYGWGAVMVPIYQGALSVLHACLSMHCESASLGIWMVLYIYIWIWLRRRDGAYISRRSERPTCVVVNALWECFTWDLDGFIWIYEYGWGAVMVPIYQGALSVLHAWLSMHCESASLGIWMVLYEYMNMVEAPWWCLYIEALWASYMRGCQCTVRVLHLGFGWFYMNIWIWLRCRDGAGIVLYGGAVMVPIYQGALSVLHAWLSMHCESASLGIWMVVYEYMNMAEVPWWCRYSVVWGCRDGAYISRRSERPTCVVVNALWECFTCDGFGWLYMNIWIWLRCRDGAYPPVN